jgi:DNA-binding NarL/FixJ family response regulator
VVVEDSSARSCRQFSNALTGAGQAIKPLVEQESPMSAPILTTPPSRITGTLLPTATIPAQRRASRPLTGLPGTAPVAAPLPVAVLGTDALSRDGVARVLAECPDMHVVAGPADGARVVLAVLDRISDAALSSLHGLVADNHRVVIVVTELEAHRAAEAMHVGVLGVIRRGQLSKASLRRVIRSAVAGDAVLPPDVLAALLDRPVASTLSGAIARLSDREAKVLQLLADGSDTREIGRELCYSERTVKTVIADITQRFGLRNRSHAVAYAIRHRLI